MLIHELRHPGGLLPSMWHYNADTEDLARDLARDRPRKARRNPENWEHFMRAMTNPTHL